MCQYKTLKVITNLNKSKRKQAYLVKNNIMSLSSPAFLSPNANSKASCLDNSISKLIINEGKLPTSARA